MSSSEINSLVLFVVNLMGLFKGKKNQDYKSIPIIEDYNKISVRIN